MPSRTDKIAIDCPFLDRRVKLIPCQKEMVVWHSERGASQRTLAKMFKVSRRLIQFTLDASKLEENKKRREERGGWKQYLNRQEQTKAQREHRAYKRTIL